MTDAVSASGPVAGAKNAVGGATDAVRGAADGVPDPRDALADASSDPDGEEEDAVEIPVSDSE